MRRKKCLFPGCENSSHCSSKVFLKISSKVAPKWCSGLGIPFSPKTDHYCCEDHVKLEDAVQNYALWRTTGGLPKLKKGYLPDFHLNEENIPISHTHIQPNKVPKNQQTSILKELLLKDDDNSLPRKKPDTVNMLPDTCILPETYIPSKVQVGVQCKPYLKDKSTNYRCQNITYGKVKKVKIEEHSSPDLLSDCESVEYIPSTYGSTTEIEETSISSSGTVLRFNILSLIEKFPRMYLGVPKPFYWIIDYIATEQKIDKLNIIMVLFKIKQNDSNAKICHLFQVNQSHLSRIFPSVISNLANFFQNLIYLPDSRVIKNNLPLAFKIRFSHVQCILDCFEIEIEKPSDPVAQSQTWSQYKGCNTAKYLVGCTPDGFVCYISSGYGGRCSDKMIVEKGDLLDILPENCVIMADRGFKAVEASLAIKNIKLLRPPSVYAGIKPDKSEVLKTKVIASLRVHIERLIRRLREFKFLKPHAVIKYQHTDYLDQIVIIACGLVNLQSKLIKDS